MKKLRRWTSGIVASFDWMVTQIENHESLVNAAIKDVGEAKARATVQLGKVKKDGRNMRKKMLELKEAESLWTDRARKAASCDEKKALECLRRKNRVLKELGDLEEQEREHARLEKQLCKDLSLVDDRLQKLKQQRNILRTRQSRAEALNAMPGDDSAIFSEIDDIFDRWEVKVAEYEISAECTGVIHDELEEEFMSEEEERELRESLAELLEGRSA